MFVTTSNTFEMWVRGWNSGYLTCRMSVLTCSVISTTDESSNHCMYFHDFSTRSIVPKYFWSKKILNNRWKQLSCTQWPKINKSLKTALSLLSRQHRWSAFHSEYHYFCPHIEGLPEAVVIQWKSLRTVSESLVLPGLKQILLKQIQGLTNTMVPMAGRKSSRVIGT